MERKKRYNKPSTKFKRKKKIPLARACKKIKFTSIKVPTFKIEKNPRIRLSKIKVRRFYIIDMAQIKAKDRRASEEDRNIFLAIEKSVTKREDQNPIKQRKRK